MSWRKQVQRTRCSPSTCARRRVWVIMLRRRTQKHARKDTPMAEPMMMPGQKWQRVSNSLPTRSTVFHLTAAAQRN